MHNEEGFVVTSLIIPLLWLVGSIIGLVRLIRHWSGFGDRSIGMLIVTIFIPLGFLWPLLAKPDSPSRMTPSRMTRRR